LARLTVAIGAGQSVVIGELGVSPPICTKGSDRALKNSGTVREARSIAVGVVWPFAPFGETPETGTFRRRPMTSTISLTGTPSSATA
jgi:hypothetical protein